MTDDCPRALRKLRDQFKFVAKVAVGLIAAIVSLPAAIAESIPSSRFTERIKVRKLVKPPSILSGTVPADLESRKGSFKTVELLFPGSLGELLNPAGVSRQGTQQILQATGNIDPGAFSEELISGVSDGWWFLPNPGKDEIEPEHENNADLDLPNSLKLDFVDSTIDDRSKTEFLDTRASDLYSKAQAAKADKNLNLYESLLVETLEVFDQQKNGDPAYRKIIETELRNFRKLNDDHRSETDEK